MNIEISVAEPENETQRNMGELLGLRVTHEGDELYFSFPKVNSSPFVFAAIAGAIKRTWFP